MFDVTKRLIYSDVIKCLIDGCEWCHWFGFYFNLHLKIGQVDG